MDFINFNNDSSFVGKSYNFVLFVDKKNKFVWFVY